MTSCHHTLVYFIQVYLRIIRILKRLMIIRFYTCIQVLGVRIPSSPPFNQRGYIEETTYIIGLFCQQKRYFTPGVKLAIVPLRCNVGRVSFESVCGS